MRNLIYFILFVTLMPMLSCSTDDSDTPSKNIVVKITGHVDGQEPPGKAITTISLDNFGTPQESDGTGSYEFVLQKNGLAKSSCQIYFLSGGGPCVVDNINILITDSETGDTLLNIPINRNVGVNNSLDEQSCRGFELNYYIETGQQTIRYF